MDFLGNELSIYTLTDAKTFLTNLGIVEDNTDILKEARIIAFITKLDPYTINPSLPFSS